MLGAVVIFVFAFIGLALVIPKARAYFFFLLLSSIRKGWEILEDYAQKKGNKRSGWLFLLALLLVIPLSVLFIAISLLAGPAYSVFVGLKHPEIVDGIVQYDKDVYGPRPKTPTKTPEEIEAENEAFNAEYFATHFNIPNDSITFLPEILEIIFYTPTPAPEIEKMIGDNLDAIKEVLKAKNLSFFYLPEYNRHSTEIDDDERLDYYNPRYGKLDNRPAEVLTYEDIRQALCIPERVDAPCFIRYNNTNGGSRWFSFWKIEIKDGQIILDAVKEYISNVGDGCLYSLGDELDTEWMLEGKTADDRFDHDVRVIGKEIRERVAKLRAWGMSALAIQKLIGDDSDKPSQLLINKQNKVLLTDYGNKEIKMEPLQKAVFFLFLRHPEGILFKELADYKQELCSIYKEVTGREDIDAIERSISRLVDPYDNSINEKCARIKNAFVSEFRPEIAQWYFIDGSKGEKKSIKLPRELVTWEIKD